MNSCTPLRECAITHACEKTGLFPVYLLLSQVLHDFKLCGLIRYQECLLRWPADDQCFEGKDKKTSYLLHHEIQLRFSVVDITMLFVDVVQFLTSFKY